MNVQSGDAELVERIRAGNDAAFTALVERYRNAVCGITFHYLQNRDDAQDAAQETFIHAYLHLHTLRDARRFGTWLTRMAANRCRDILRQRSRRDPTRLPVPESLHGADSFADRLGQRLFLHDALGCLSEKVRLTVTLCYVGEYSHDEIARFLDVPVGTVRSRLRQAKKQLREEMKTMASEIFGEVQPGPDWTAQVVEEAIRRGQQAMDRHARGDAVSVFDVALAALEQTPITQENRRFTLDLLRRKFDAVGFTAETESRLALLHQALAMAQKLADKRTEAEIHQDLGRTERDRTKAAEHYRNALTLFREQNDAEKQAECLLLLGVNALFQDDAITGRKSLSEAVSLFEATEAKDWQGVCAALLAMLSDTESVGLSRLLLWAGMCDSLETSDSNIRFVGQPGFQLSRQTDAHPAALFTGSVFWQLSALRTVLDSSLPVGRIRPGEVFSFSCQPLQATLRVVSATEQVTVPAGVFDNCLLMELITAEGAATDDAPERSRLLNRTVLCGRRHAWYAPGVGLVQLRIEPEQGTEVLIQLHRYAIPNISAAYLPLAVGNTWTYGWANVPPEYVAEESYRVTAQTGDRWHMAHWAFVYERPTAN